MYDSAIAWAGAVVFGKNVVIQPEMIVYKNIKKKYYIA